jgi:hypothetical protein
MTFSPQIATTTGVPNFGLGDLVVTRAVPQDIRQDYVNSTLSYVGYAQPGMSIANKGWRILKVVSSGGNVTSVTWATGLGNSDLIWKDTTDLTITAITRANPGVVTVASTATLGGTGATKQITITGVAGMTEVNNAQYTATVINGTTFSIGVNTTAYTAYTSGGTVNLAEYLNYTYS